MKALYYNNSYEVTPQYIANHFTEKFSDLSIKIIGINDHSLFDPDLQRTQVYLENYFDSFHQELLKIVINSGAFSKNEQLRH